MPVQAFYLCRLDLLGFRVCPKPFGEFGLCYVTFRQGHPKEQDLLIRGFEIAIVQVEKRFANDKRGSFVAA